MAWEAEVREQTARERPCRHVLTSDGKCVGDEHFGFDPIALVQRLIEET